MAVKGGIAVDSILERVKGLHGRDIEEADPLSERDKGNHRTIPLDVVKCTRSNSLSDNSFSWIRGIPRINTMNAD